MNRKTENPKKNISVRLKDNVAVVTVDCFETKVNAVSSGLLDEIAGHLNKIEADKTLKGVVILSGKKDNFIVGADVEELKSMKDRSQVIAYITKCHDVLARLTELEIPLVCAIHGNCLGGGLELALAADYRLASDSPETVLGFPEIRLGLIPAGGGTQRLPRLVGIQNALTAMLQGTSFRPNKALKIGLIDEIVAPYGMEEIAIRTCHDLAAGRTRKKKIKRSFQEKLLESTAPGRPLIFSKAREMVMKQTSGLYPAAPAIIDSVSYGYKKGIKEGQKHDIDIFGDLVTGSESAALLSLFDGMTALKKNPMKTSARCVNKIAILGAGLMGSGIASVSTDVCDTILLKDVTLESAAKGMQEIWKGLDKRARSGAIVPFEKHRQYGKIIPCTDYANFKNTDLVIEAVFEDLSLKRKILCEVEGACREKTIFASNTSAIPITSIARDAKRPENVIGMHYFSPVPKMPLLEIITTEKTALWVTATALDFGIAQGKTCIVVKDGPGFYTTRILAPLLFESSLLVYEGAKISEIDQAMKCFGYPVGPMTLLDEIGIDVGAHVTEGLKIIFSDRDMEPPFSLLALVDAGFKGRKSAKGMYRYDVPKKKGKRQVNMEVYRIFGQTPGKKIEYDEIQKRVSLMMINEAAYCLQEGILSCPRDGDIGAVFGLGFPPFTGGPFRYMDRVGIVEIVKDMERLQKTCGNRFKPADILVRMALKNGKFYK